MAKKGKKKGSDGKACWEGYYYAGYDAKKKKGGFDLEPPAVTI